MIPSAVVLLGLALVCANLPFLLRQPLLLWPAQRMAGRRSGALPPSAPPSGHPHGGKSLWWCLLEWFAFYLLAVATGMLLEGRLGPVKEQAWQFYATTLCMFIVFAFPGFVYRYLWRRAGV